MLNLQDYASQISHVILQNHIVSLDIAEQAGKPGWIRFKCVRDKTCNLYVQVEMGQLEWAASPTCFGPFHFQLIFSS